MKKINRIKMFMNDFPVFQSDYLDWSLKISSCDKKRRKKLEEFYRAILGVAHPDWLLDFTFIEIDGQKMTFDLLKDYDLDDAIVKLEAISFEDLVDGEYFFGEVKEEKTTEQLSQELIEEQAAKLINAVKALKQEAESESFYYHSVPITEDVLFETVCVNGIAHRRIRDSLLPHVKFFNLEKIDFFAVDIRGCDLSYSNAKIIPDVVYMRSFCGTNLKNVPLKFTTLRGIDCKNANLEGTFAVIDAESCLIDGIVVDSTCVIYNAGGIFPRAGKRFVQKPIIHF